MNSEPKASRSAVHLRKAVQVVDKDCATQWGNDGLEVLSTPAILGAMERICVEALKPALNDGEMTVGIAVRMNHRAAVPLGEFVTYEIEGAIDGKRVGVDFRVTRDDGTVVSDGHHSRAIVDADRFVSRIARRPASPR